MVQEPIINTAPQRPVQRGQALIEYALILVLVVFALIAAIAATGPALGNVFSNTVFNLVGITGTPQNLSATGGPAPFWAQMTAIALNPPAARVFPTAELPPATLPPTAGPSPTPRPTNTPVPTVPTATLPPTPTALDMEFSLPYIDPIDQPVWWRVDSSAYLGGADWRGEYFPNTTLSGTPDRILYNQEIDSQFNVNFNWGTGSPLDSWLNNNFSIRYTRIIDIQPGTVPVRLNFTLDSQGGSRLKINGATVIDFWGGHTAGSPQTWTQTFTPNATATTPHTIVVEYNDPGGNASVSLGITTDKGNVAADGSNAGGAVNCPWSQINGSQPNTVSFAWKENFSTAANGFPTRMRCNLELRGYVDLAGVANPSMSFWDVWDFGSLIDGSTTVKLQFAEYAAYNADLSGGPNWGAGSSITLHTTGKNYAWTRNEYAIPATLLNKKVTWRFVMDSGSNTTTTTRRWYLDDIRLAAGSAPKTFGVCTVNKYTCNGFWELDVADEKADFITSGRWDLTNMNAAANDSGGPSMSWDISSVGTAGSSGQYARFGTEQGSSNRIHYVALDGQIDLRSIGVDGNGGTPDWEGDLGYPILSFYHAYGLEAGDSIEVQYTRDADTPGTPANWARVGTNPIQTVAVAGSPITDIMKRYDLQLKTIPNWNTQTFRLRFALIVNNDKENTGWYIDNIGIEREGLMQFGNYPFCDDAENTTDQWLLGGAWGIATTSGAFNTGNSFSDSPLGNYINGQVSSMATRYAIDFNNDTPENLANWGGNKSCFNGLNSGAAIRPVLSFYHWRQLASSKSFRIELFRAAQIASGTSAIAPVSVWNYNYIGTNNANQVVWEREELDMRAAIETATGLSWAVLTNATGPGASKYDDDFYLQFTFDALSGSGVSDGIYIDNIVMNEYSESSFKLWPTSTNYTARAGAPVAGAGNGTNWVDNIDTPDDWYNRWTTSSTWTAVSWDSHTDFNSLHNNGTFGQNYLNQSFNVIEMTKILDLRGTLNTDLPTMYFWTHYSVSSGDAISVDVAVQDEVEMTTAPAPRNRMGYDYQYLWGSTNSYAGGANTSWGGASSWQDVWTNPITRNDAWHRVQIDLRNYVGKRLKVRFVLNALNTSGTSMGWWLDDIQFVLRTNAVMTLNDNASNMNNWIAEGRWGLAPDEWRGSGGGPAELGTNPWSVFWFDCINWIKNPTQPGPNAAYLNQETCSTSNWTTFFNNVTRTPAGTNTWIDARAALATNPLVANQHFIKDFTAVVNYPFGTDGRPSFASDTWYDNYGARFMRTITVVGGEYTFITTSDAAVRVRVETVAGGVPVGFPSSPYWNVIENWSSHSRTVDYQAVTLTPGNYQVIMEYFETSGDAIVQLQIGNNRFSFGDTPKAGAGATFPVINSIPFSDSSLILKGVLDLRIPAGLTAAQWKPRLEYYQLYNFASSMNGMVEVSADGGFTWVQTGLRNLTTCPATIPNPDLQCDPTTSGAAQVLTQNGDEWEQRSLSLSSFVGQSIGLRFKLHTGSSTADGWWITDIVVGNTG